MSEQQDPGAVISLEERINQIAEQLNSARILIRNAQAALAGIFAELVNQKIRSERTKQEERHD